MASGAALLALEEKWGCQNHHKSIMVDYDKEVVISKEERLEEEPVFANEQPIEREDVDMGWLCSFGNVKMAKGYNWLGTARGPLVMSNVFLSTALIFLASEEVGCVYEDDNGDMLVDDECDERVYGAFLPSALITNIAVISGILSALFMPLAGALVDYTSHRWTTGVVSAMLMTAVQVIQIGTNSNTWFAMSILQAITGCFYQVQVLASYSYLSDIALRVTPGTMTKFTSTFTMVQFGAQAVFLMIVVAPSMGLNLDDVQTARLSQGINSISVIISFTLGWRLLPKVPPRHTLEEGKSIIWECFAQNWNTAKRINRDYKKSLRWFLCGVLFAEPAANAFTIVAVVFLKDRLKMSGSDIGIFFLVVLVFMIPGGMICQLLAQRTDANTSVRVSMFMLFLLSVFGGLILTEDNTLVTYLWGMFVGLMLGCYYPSMKLFLSLVVPRGQEAEITGFYVYCTQLLVWLPPLIFSTMVESNVDQGIGVIAVGCFFLISIAVFSMAAPFDELLEEVRSTASAPDEGAHPGDSISKDVAHTVQT